MAQKAFAAKMALIGVFFLLPVTLLIVLLYLQINADVSFYRLERVGTSYTKALRPLFADLEADQLTDSAPAIRNAIAKRVEADFAAAFAVNAGPGRELGLTQPLEALAARWKAHAPAQQSLSDLIVLLGLVSDNSKITLDPMLDGYYVGDTMVNKVPSVIDSAAQVGVVGTRWLTNGSLSVNDRIAMTILSGQVETARRNIEHNLGIAEVAAPYVQPRLRAARLRANAATATYATWLGVHLLKPHTPQGSIADLRTRQAAALAAGFALYDGTIDAMAEVLDRRIDALVDREIIIFIIVALAIASAGALMLVTTRSMSRHLADKVSLQHEIVERIGVEKKLAFAAFHDELTGLSNRALLMDRLNHIVSKRHTGDLLWALVFMDLDRFKVVNDSLGHKAGDLVLIEASRRLERCLRGGDTLARLGGDEFVILLDDIDDIEQACVVADRILRTFEAPFMVAGHELFASASIGIATSRNDEERPDDVLRNADIAMYRAKQLGKQRYEVFTPDMLTSAVLRLELETDLARALERNELCLFYQPLISIEDGRLTGFEALVR